MCACSQMFQILKLNAITMHARRKFGEAAERAHTSHNTGAENQSR